MWTDPGWFIPPLAVWISYWSLAARPPTSHTCVFSLCILVLSGELKPWSLLNKIRPPSQICPPGRFSPAPSPPLNVIEINKSLGRGWSLIEDFGTWLTTSGPSCSKVDSSIHQITLYSMDSAIGFTTTYPLDRELSSGWSNPPLDNWGL